MGEGQAWRAAPALWPGADLANPELAAFLWTGLGGGGQLTAAIPLFPAEALPACGVCVPSLPRHSSAAAVAAPLSPL